MWAAGLIALHGVWAVSGLLGGPRPFAVSGNPDSTFPEHWLAGLAPRLVEWVTVAVAGVVVVLVTWMQVRHRPTWVSAVVVVVGWTIAASLVLLVPGNLSLYTIPGFDLLTLHRVGPPELSVVLLCAAGYALGVETLRYQRWSTVARCSRCGRNAHDRMTRARWRLLGAAAAVAAAVAPLGYAVVRVAWAAGIPIGTTAAFLDRINAANPGSGTVVMELVLATMAIGGGVLCWGPTRPWSQTWPRWVPLLHGCPVPRWFPSWLGVLCGAGLFGYATLLVPDGMRMLSGQKVYFAGTDVEMTWSSQVPALALILWSPLIITASLAFGYRTRPRCPTCGRL